MADKNDVFNSTAKGAAYGSALGPMGTGIGAAAGFTMGLFSRMGRKDAQRAQERADAAREAARLLAQKNRNTLVERNYARRRSSQGLGNVTAAAKDFNIANGAPSAGGGGGNTASQQGTILSTNAATGAPSILG